MPIIKPASALRNNYPEISRLTHDMKQPVFLTINGSGDTVLLSVERYDEIMAKVELYEKLAEGEADINAGRVKTLDEVSALMLAKIAEFKN